MLRKYGILAFIAATIPSARMRKTRLILVPVFALLALLGFITPASAEFLSLAKGFSGESIAAEQTVEAGGGTFTCDSTGGAGSWLVKRGSEPARKGPALLVAFKLWDDCVAESSELEPTTATGSECREEFLQPREEATITETISSICSLKVEVDKEICEVKLEPGSNKELKEVSVYNSGLESLNTVLAYNTLRVTTQVNAACEKAGVGIGATSEGKIGGTSENEKVQPGQRLGTFVLGYSPNNVFRRMGEKRTVTVINTAAGTASPRLFFEAQRPSIPFWGITGLRFCETLSYNSRQACPMEVELVRPLATGIVASWVRAVDPAGGQDRVDLFAPPA